MERMSTDQRLRRLQNRVASGNARQDEIAHLASELARLGRRGEAVNLLQPFSRWSKEAAHALDQIALPNTSVFCRTCRKPFPISPEGIPLNAAGRRHKNLTYCPLCGPLNRRASRYLARTGLPKLQPRYCGRCSAVTHQPGKTCGSTTTPG